MSTRGKQHLDECQQSIKTTEDISHFMLSTINRCLDFTKASTGMALSASNSSFDLRAALHWVLNSLRRSEENSYIRLLELSSDIADYILSDQQVIVRAWMLAHIGSAQCVAFVYYLFNFIFFVTLLFFAVCCVMLLCCPAFTVVDREHHVSPLKCNQIRKGERNAGRVAVLQDPGPTRTHIRGGRQWNGNL
jgi:hypothetical protein